MKERVGGTGHPEAPGLHWTTPGEGQGKIPSSRDSSALPSPSFPLPRAFLLLIFPAEEVERTRSNLPLRQPLTKNHLVRGPISESQPRKCSSTKVRDLSPIRAKLSRTTPLRTCAFTQRYNPSLGVRGAAPNLRRSFSKASLNSRTKSASGGGTFLPVANPTQVPRGGLGQYSLLLSAPGFRTSRK